jgi:hypothetical protein
MKLLPSGKWRRRAAIAAVVTPAMILGLWIAIHRVRWLGPLLADGARAVLGTSAVAKLEDFAYGVQDRVNLAARKGEQPVAYWDVPASAAPPRAAASAAAAPAGSAEVTFRPADVGPIFPKFAAPGDGVWVPVVDARRPNDSPLLYKTLLHPDPKRPWTAIAIVAIAVAHVDLHLVAGRNEPKGSTPEAEGYKRTALVSEAHHESLLAAWNGGFKAEHGRWGMRVDGVTLLPPRAEGCAIALYRDGSLAIRPWKQIEDTQERMTWFRQTPACFVDEGKMHPGLTAPENTAWGAAVGGNTVIRRSAMGLSEDRKTLFVAIGDAAAAPIIASSMRYVGARWVAQLDVNWSFPKFLLYEPRSSGSKELVAKPLAKGFEYTEDEYVRERALRDFFYVTRKSPTASR